jgi:hypothetical protein
MHTLPNEYVTKLLILHSIYVTKHLCYIRAWGTQRNINCQIAVDCTFLESQGSANNWLWSPQAAWADDIATLFDLLWTSTGRLSRWDRMDHWGPPKYHTYLNLHHEMFPLCDAIHKVMFKWNVCYTFRPITHFMTSHLSWCWRFGQVDVVRRKDQVDSYCVSHPARGGYRWLV